MFRIIKFILTIKTFLIQKYSELVTKHLRCKTRIHGQQPNNVKQDLKWECLLHSVTPEMTPNQDVSRDCDSWIKFWSTEGHYFWSSQVFGGDNHVTHMYAIRFLVHSNIHGCERIWFSKNEPKNSKIFMIAWLPSSNASLDKTS